MYRRKEMAKLINVLLEPEKHALLKAYCDEHGIKFYKFLGQAVSEKINRERAMAAEQEAF